MPTALEALYELDLGNAYHVGGAAEREMIRQRRERVAKWLHDTDAIPSPPAANVFEGFLTYSQRLVSELQRVSGALKNYAGRAEVGRPFNIYLQAPPGGGKSTLAKSLCSSIGHPQLIGKLVEVNCSNLLSPADIIPVFDRIALLKENNILPVVFFDEVDVPQWSLYQFLLMPMYDGAYMVQGHRRKFDSAIFFFAGSFEPERKRPQFFVQQTENDWFADEMNAFRVWLASDNAPGKARDFHSRIDVFVRLPPLRCHFVKPFNDEPSIYWQDMETIQIVKRLVGEQCPDVEQIDARVLEFLTGAFLDSKRELERLIFLSKVPATEKQFLWKHLPLDAIQNGPWCSEVGKKPEKLIALKLLPAAPATVAPT